MTLDAFEFMRRFLQHVLPKGFMKIRYYGFMSPGCSIGHEELAAMIELALNFECLRPTPPMEAWEKCCPRCGSRMVLDVTLLGHEWDAIVNQPIHR